MNHTFLAVDVSLIPQETKNIPSFTLNKFSNDSSRILLSGRENGVVRYSQETMLAWLQGEADPQATLDILIDSSIEYTKAQIKAQFRNPQSIWYSPIVSDE